jgi:hypothetical protein
MQRRAHFFGRQLAADLAFEGVLALHREAQVLHPHPGLRGDGLHSPRDSSISGDGPISGDGSVSGDGPSYGPGDSYSDTSWLSEGDRLLVERIRAERERALAEDRHAQGGLSDAKQDFPIGIRPDGSLNRVR